MTGSGLWGGSAQDAKNTGNLRGAHTLGVDVDQGDGLRRIAIRNSYGTRSRSTTPHPKSGSLLPAIALSISPGRPRSPVGLGTVKGRYSAGSKIITSTVDSLLPSPWKLKNGTPHNRAGRRSCSRTQSQNHLNRLRLHPSFASAASCPAGEPSPAGRLHRRESFSESNIAARCRSSAVDTLTPHAIGTDDLDGCTCSRPLSPAPPCSTTSLDYHRHPKTVLREAGLVDVGSWLRRCATPRGNNPHPVGLVFQSPYNRHSKTFEIWNPDMSVIESRLPRMVRHIGNTNFTCGKMKPFSPVVRGGPSDVRFSLASMYRQSYRRPQEAGHYDRNMPTVRFGSTPNHSPAVGIVPNVMSPRTQEASNMRTVRLRLPMGRNKVASLV